MMDTLKEVAGPGMVKRYRSKRKATPYRGPLLVPYP